MVVEAAKLGAACLWLAAACVGLKTLGLSRLLALMPPARSGPLPDRRLRVARRQAELISRAARFLPFKCACLPRSVALCWWLRARGIDASLRLGVQKAGGGQIQAHAWVEVDGEVIGDRPDVVATFTTLSREPAR